MRLIAFFLLSALFFTGQALAFDLAGKCGFGLRSSAFSYRKFINNNWGIDLSAAYNSGTQSGQADSNQIDYAAGAFWVKEIFPNVLFEAGATLQQWQGTAAGTYYNGLSINPFIGGECFINDHFAVDFKIFVFDYYSQMTGPVRSTGTSLFDGNLGAHIYL